MPTAATTKPTNGNSDAIVNGPVASNQPSPTVTPILTTIVTIPAPTVPNTPNELTTFTPELSTTTTTIIPIHHYTNPNTNTNRTNSNTTNNNTNPNLKQCKLHVTIIFNITGISILLLLFLLLIVYGE